MVLEVPNKASFLLTVTGLGVTTGSSIGDKKLTLRVEKPRGTLVVSKDTATHLSLFTLITEDEAISVDLNANTSSLDFSGVGRYYLQLWAEDGSKDFTHLEEIVLDLVDIPAIA